MVSNDVLLERLARMVLALRRRATLSFDAGASMTEFTVTVPRGAEEPQLAVRCHVRKRDGSMFTDRWDGCNWTMDNFYEEAALFTDADLMQLPPVAEINLDPVAVAITQLNSLTPTTICGHRLLLQPRQNSCPDLPPLEIVAVNVNDTISSLRPGIDWADDYVHP